MSEKSEMCLKKRKYDSKYKTEWASEFAGVVKGSEETRAKCTFCITEFSIVHGGKHDIKRHCNSTSQSNLKGKAVEDSRKNGKQARLLLLIIDRPSIAKRRVCGLLSFKVNASSCCYGIKLDRGLVDGVRKAVSKANADLAVARAEEHMMEMKTLEERI